ncbi:MAG TPA: TcpQ domain-containing protein, partial [Alphaproteobacteria bacterium]
SSGHDTPLALAMPSLIPAGYRFVLNDVDPMTPVSWQAGDDWVSVMQTALTQKNMLMSIDGRTITIAQRSGESDPVIERSQTVDAQAADATPVDEVNAVPAMTSDTVPVGIWAGAKGENLSDVLEAWGLMSGVNVRVDLDGDYKLPKDVKYEGRFDEAVQSLLGQFDGSKRPSGTFLGLADAKNAPSPSAVKRAASAPRAPYTGEKLVSRSVSPDADSTWRPSKIKKPENNFAPMKQMAPVPDPADAPKTVKPEDKVTAKAKTSGTWSAMEGTSLRDVLEHWGQDAHVDVVWMSDQNFPLPETIKKKGKFEDAVMDALAQYEDQQVRPTAQLNKDPETGSKALIIKTNRL